MPRWQNVPAHVSALPLSFGAVAAAGGFSAALGPSVLAATALVGMSSLLRWLVPTKPDMTLLPAAPSSEAGAASAAATKSAPPQQPQSLFSHVGYTEVELELPANAQTNGQTIERPTDKFKVAVLYPADPRHCHQRSTCAARSARGRPRTLPAAALLLPGESADGSEQQAHAPAGRATPQMKYMKRADWTALSQTELKIPATIFSHLGNLQIDAWQDVVPHPHAGGGTTDGAADGRRPVIVFSHGLTALPMCYWSVLSAFVRAGFVVLAPTHNDGSAARLELSDGTEHHFKTTVDLARDLGIDIDDPAYQQAHAEFVRGVPASASSQPALRQQLEAAAWGCRQAQLQRRAAEMRCCVDALLAWAAPASASAAAAGGDESRRMQRLLRGIVDPARVAFVGHSFGGATALLAAEQDDRPSCCAAWDPWVQQKGPVPPEVLAAGLPRCPQQLTLCSAWADGEVMRQLSELRDSGRLHPESTVSVLPGTGHQNYTDFALLAPVVVKKLGMIGSADPRETLGRVVASTLDFISQRCTAIVEKATL